MLVQHNAGYIADDRNEITPSFWDMGAQLAYKFHLTNSINLELSGGVKNIFDSFQNDIDRGANRDSVYIFGPMMPRTYFLGLKFTL